VTGAERGTGSIDALIAEMGHELRSPLNAIIGFSDLLLLELPGPLTEAQRHQLTEIRAAGDALLRLTDDLVELARLERGEMTPRSEAIPMAPFLDDVRTSFEVRARERELSLEVDVDGLDSCRSDPMLLGRILGHLVGNAIAYTETGGVTIRGHAGARGEAVVEVMDTGAGISEHDRAMLFQPFDRGAADVPRRGIGLGLFLSRRLAELLGTEITVRTEVGRGSTFRVDLPAVP
jgi:protein-histidine pros-kinase